MRREGQRRVQAHAGRYVQSLSVHRRSQRHALKLQLRHACRWAAHVWHLRNEGYGQKGRAPDQSPWSDRPHILLHAGLIFTLPHEPPAGTAYGRMGQAVPGGRMGMHPSQTHWSLAGQREQVRQRAVRCRWTVVSSLTETAVLQCAAGATRSMALRPGKPEYNHQRLPKLPNW